MTDFLDDPASASDDAMIHEAVRVDLLALFWGEEMASLDPPKI